MDVRKSITRAEFVLLGLSAVFLCFLSGLYLRDRAAAALPFSVETERPAAPEEVHPPAPPPLDLNTATEEALTELPGIGEVLSRQIVAYRDANGPFQTVEELLNVSGIGPAKLANLEGLVTVSGEKTAERASGKETE